MLSYCVPLLNYLDEEFYTFQEDMVLCVCVCVCALKMILLPVFQANTNSDCYLTIISVTQNIVSNDRTAVNNELKRKSQKAVEAYFKAVFRHLSRGIEKIYKRRLDWLVSQSRF
jgi:hypothetical protein